MKRYVKSASATSSSKLVSALDYLLRCTIDWDNDLEDIVNGLAFAADIELPDEYDEDRMLKTVLKQLVDQRSNTIPEYIIYPFTEYPETLLEEISTSSPSGKKSKLYKVISVIYSQIGEFPGGDAVKKAIEDNIFSSSLIEGNAAEIGYAIGHIYWEYITQPEYGVRSNFASAVGVSNGCRDDKVVNGKYKYGFVQEISSYYYEDLRKNNPGMPMDTGYVVKFYNEGADVYADIFNVYTVHSKVEGVAEWDIGTTVLDTIKINGTDEAAIESAAREIADWYNTHVDAAIESAVQYAK